MTKALAYGTNHSFTGLKSMEIDRRAVGPEDVEIEILYCGVRHSDLRQAENAWSNTVYPRAPGHEIVGQVTSTDSAATKFKVGDIVGVGCIVDRCGTCEQCHQGAEDYCESPNGFPATYNGSVVPEAAPGTNIYGQDNTFNDYSTVIVVKEG